MGWDWVGTDTAQGTQRALQTGRRPRFQPDLAWDVAQPLPAEAWDTGSGPAQGAGGAALLPEWSSEIRGWEGQSGALLKPRPVGLCGPGLPWLAVDHPTPPPRPAPLDPAFRHDVRGTQLRAPFRP